MEKPQQRLVYMMNNTADGRICHRWLCVIFWVILFFTCIDGMLRILGTARVRLFDAAHRRFVLRAAHRQQHRRRRQLDSTFRLGRNHLHHSAHALETGQFLFSSHYSFCGQEKTSIIFFLVVICKPEMNIRIEGGPFVVVCFYPVRYCSRPPVVTHNPILSLVKRQM